MNNVLVLYKNTTLERTALEKDTPYAERLIAAHDAHYTSLDKVLKTLSALKYQHEAMSRAEFEKEKRPITDKDLVIAVGGDGMFLFASHHIDDIPLLGVNSDVKTSIGYYCATDADGLAAVLANAPRTIANRMEVRVNGELLPVKALNDIMIAHESPGASTCFDLIVGRQTERYRCSGLLASTPIGSTGWMYQNNGMKMQITDPRIQYLPRDMRGVKPKFSKEISLANYTAASRIYIDGDNAVYDLPLEARVDLRLGSPITIVGDIQKKMDSF